MNSILTAIVGAMNWFPGLKTKAAAVAGVLVALLVAVDIAMKQFGASFEIPYLTEINTFLVALAALGAANQSTNAVK